MSKLQALAFCAATLLGGCAAALAPPETTDETAPEITITVYEQPSPEANLIYHVLVAELAHRRGHSEITLDSYRAAAGLTDDVQVVERAATLALALSEDDPAVLELSRRWYALAPANAQARQALALALLRNGNVEEAVEHLEAVRSEAAGREQHDGFATVGSLLGQVEDKTMALRVMALLRERHPQSLHAAYYYALAALDVDDAEAALKSLETTLAQNPDWGQGHLLQARIMTQTGAGEAALEALAKAVARLPDDRELRSGYARLLVNAERMEAAREQFKILVGQNPQDAESLFLLGLLAVDAKQYDQAVTYFMDMLRQGARTMDVYYELGKVEELRENFAAAKDWYGRVIAGERYLPAQVRLGAVLAKQGEFEALHAHFATLRRDMPGQAVSLHLAEAELLREAGRYRETFDLLEEALALDPDDHDLLYAHALAAEKIDRLDILERNLRKLIEADPQNAHALNALGYTLADRTTRYQEALDYLKRAIQLLPEDAAVLDSMGWIKYRLGDYEESLKYLRRAYDLSADAEIASHLSEVLWVIQRHEEAREIWRRAIEAHPNDPYLLRVKERFDL